MEFISKADHRLIEIKDEDIAIDDGNKRRRYRLKKRKVNVKLNNKIKGLK